MSKPKLEIACFNYESAVIAQEAGADRIELCENYSLGGLTPSKDLLERVIKALSIDVYVMIRPSSRDFIYTSTEFLEMKENILHFKKMGVKGFVFGILTNHNTIDVERNTALIQLAHPLPCTFHRAFDETNNPSISLQELINCGFKTVLSAGQSNNALLGMEVLRHLHRLSNHQITIMPGGGVRSSNIQQIHQVVKSSFYHSAAITNKGAIANKNEVEAMKMHLNNLS